MTAPYTVQQWHDNDTNPPYGPLDGDRLNHMEAGILAAAIAADGGVALNVKTFGALGDGVQDDYTFIMLAYAALPATGGTLYFPAGRYRHNTPLAFAGSSTKQVSLVGAGPSTVLVPTFSSGDAVTVTGATLMRASVSNMHIEPSVARDQSAYNLTLVNTLSAVVSNVSMENALGGALYQFDTCVFLKVAGCQGRSSGSASGTALRIKNCNGSPQFANSRFETGNGVVGYTGCKPALHVTGVCTGLRFTGTTFVGAGPRSQFAVTSVTSDASKFTVTTSATHDFRVGDFVVLRGMTPAAYNSQWRIATVPTGTTFTVTYTPNPGTSSVNGTAESVAACALVTNEDTGSAASINESGFTGCLFEASQTGLYGSAALYLDGRRGNSSQSGTLSGWTLTGNYYDQYATGLLLSGMASNAAFETTVNGISVAGGMFVARCRAVHIDQAQAVLSSDLSGSVPGGAFTPLDDGVSVSAGVYIYAGPGAPLTQGVSIANSQFGMGRNWQTANNVPYKYGILLDGPGINDLTIVGNDLFGSIDAFGLVNSPVVASQRWKIKSNSVASGSLPTNNSTYLPSVASSPTVDISKPFEIFKVTGGTNISSLTGGWIGREIKLLFVSALSLLPGGTFSTTAGRAVSAGELVDLTFDGTSWFPSGAPPVREQLALTAAGVIAENASPLVMTSGLAPATQVVAGSLVGLSAGDVVTGILLRNNVAAAGTLPTTVRFGLADVTGKILVLSGNLNSLANWVTGTLQFPFTAPYTVLADGGYYPVFVVNGVWGTTQPTPLRAGVTQFSGNQYGAKAPLVLAQAGQTDLPSIGSSLVVANNSNVFYYMGVY